MPYEMKCSAAGCNVHKKGESTPKNKKPMSEEAATKYMAALYANTEGGKKDLSDLEYAVIEEKCYSENYAPYVDKLTQEQANYNPLGGVTNGERACATCRWFNVGADSCYVVSGPIVPTGLSDMYMPVPPPYKPEPMPVVIVNHEDMHGDMHGKSGGDKEVQLTPTKMEFPLLRVEQKSDPEPLADVGFKVMDNGRWVGWWTNSARDKLKEKFSVQAIDDFIARVDSKQLDYPELWFKHLPIRIGQADVLARVGYMAMASGTFDNTSLGQKGRAWFEAKQKAGDPLTMSHQYLFPKSAKVNGVYHAFNTFELSPLDYGEEANPVTQFFSLGAKAMPIVIDAKKKAELLAAFGNDESKVNALLNFGEAQSKAMAEAGLDVKSLEAAAAIINADPGVSTVQSEVKELTEATLAGFKTLAQRVDEAITAGKKADELATKLDETNQALSNLKSFIEKELNYTPRASKSDRTRVPETNKTVQHLKQQQAAAGQKSEAQAEQDLADTPVQGGKKSILEEVVAAMKNGRGS